MNCPRCETATLDERDRDGVTIDTCRTCRGVWLDRGELEKVIARTTAEFDDHVKRPRDAPAPGRHRDDDDHRGGRRKKGWLESFGDIFD